MSGKQHAGRLLSLFRAKNVPKPVDEESQGYVSGSTEAAPETPRDNRRSLGSASGDNRRPSTPRQVVPDAFATCTEHQGQNPFDALGHDSASVSGRTPRQKALKIASEPERVKVIVGTGEEKTIYVVHRSLLQYYSRYFSTAYNASAFAESQTNTFELDEDDPELFDVFVEWLYLCPECKMTREYDPGHKCLTKRSKRSPWCQRDYEVYWTAADRFMADEFARFLLGQLVQHLEHLEIDRIIWIYQNTLPSSTMCRAVRHWVGFSRFRASSDVRKEIERSLGEHIDRRELLQTWSHKDPRKYKLDHWSQPCSGGDSIDHALSADCAHRVSFWSPGGIPTPISPSRWVLRRLIILIWIAAPVEILVLSSALWHFDRDSSYIEGVVKRFDLALGIMMVPGILSQIWAYCMVIFAVAAGGVSARSVKHCQAWGTKDEYICRINVTIMSFQFSYGFFVVWCVYMVRKHWRGVVR